MSQKHNLPESPSKVSVYFDGACSPRNPGGYSTFGWWIEKDNEVYAFDNDVFCLPGPDSTCNVAEYAGLIAGLKAVIDANLHLERFTVKGDSRLVINQMTRYWNVRSPLLRTLYLQATELVSQCRYVSFQWIPREQNGDADYLSKQAYLACCADVDEVGEC